MGVLGRARVGLSMPEFADGGSVNTRIFEVDMTILKTRCAATLRLTPVSVVGARLAAR
jgi:hypothetical protein